MTADLRAALAFRVFAVFAVAGTVWLADLGHPWLAALTAWAAFLAVFLGGRCHAAYLRPHVDHVNRIRRTLTDEETTTR